MLSLQELQNKLKAEHMEDMQGSMVAHRAAIESVKSEADKSRIADLEESKKEHHKEMGKCAQHPICFIYILKSIFFNISYVPIS